MAEECSPDCVRCGFKSRQWICDNIYDIGSRRDRPTSMRTQQINETFRTQAVRDFRLREGPSILGVRRPGVQVSLNHTGRVDQISSKHRTRSERRSPSGTRSDHRSPPRRRDDQRQPSVRSESNRGRSSPPRQRHGNSPTPHRQSKRSRHHRGHVPSRTSELSARLSDRPGTHEPRRGDYTSLKLRHNPVEAHQEQSERPRKTPRSTTITYPRDETLTARLVSVQRREYEDTRRSRTSS